MTIIWEVSQPPITKISLKFIYLQFQSNPSGGKDLMMRWWKCYLFKTCCTKCCDEGGHSTPTFKVRTLCNVCYKQQKLSWIQYIIITKWVLIFLMFISQWIWLWYHEENICQLTHGSQNKLTDILKATFSSSFIQMTQEFVPNCPIKV